MGLGPSDSSLRERVRLPEPVWSNPFAMQMEGIARREARQERARYLASKNKVPRKAEAPARPKPKLKGYERQWIWEGEDLPSKGILKGQGFSATELRKLGFKLPKLKGGKKT